MKWVFICVLVCMVKVADFSAIKIGSNNKVQTSLQTDEHLILPEFGPECLAGSSWKSRCNQCLCTEKGRKVCTKNICDNVKDEVEMSCAPNTYWKNDCNSCFCTDTGVAGCTEMGCIHKPLPITPSTTTPSPPELGEGKECKVGSKWKSQCNDCGCTPEGYSYCTEKACIGFETEELMKCGPNTTWKNDCNTCWCTDGRPICTKIGCNMPVVELHFDDEIVDKKENEYINHNRVKREVCKPKQSFEKECNSCQCSIDGASYHCSQNECMDPNDKDVEVFMESKGKDHIERHAVCDPKTNFKIRCNDCVCNVDGTDYACTNKQCQLPEDVEIFHELTEIKPVVP